MSATASLILPIVTNGKTAIWALISPGNDPSMKLAEKLGFVRQPDGMYRERPQTIWLRPA